MELDGWLKAFLWYKHHDISESLVWSFSSFFLCAQTHDSIWCIHASHANWDAAISVGTNQPFPCLDAGGKWEAGRYSKVCPLLSTLIWLATNMSKSTLYQYPQGPDNPNLAHLPYLWPCATRADL